MLSLVSSLLRARVATAVFAEFLTSMGCGVAVPRTMVFLGL